MSGYRTNYSISCPYDSPPPSSPHRAMATERASWEEVLFSTKSQIRRQSMITPVILRYSPGSSHTNSRWQVDVVFYWMKTKQKSELLLTRRGQSGENHPDFLCKCCRRTISHADRADFGSSKNWSKYISIYIINHKAKHRLNILTKVPNILLLFFARLHGLRACAKKYLAK